MRKQITFYSTYPDAEGEAIEWLLNLSKCFEIEKVQLKKYTLEKSNTKYRCKLIVEYK